MRMEWARWKPFYLEILRDFNFDPKKDIEAAMVLSKLVETRRIPNYRTIVDKLGKHVSICGASSSLEKEIGNLSDDETIISAGSATSRLMRKGIMPDVVVTDLDGEVEYQVEASSYGALLFVHAHGDNIPALYALVPKLTGLLVPTVQCQPFGEVYNFGGFTDGDRCYTMARHFGIEDIRFIGWDTDHVFKEGGKDLEMKQKKLMWADRIVGNYSI
jgi:2-amino-4-hydroxy-6-hydroxymethyldihydropteridine diphosphokinase